MIQFINLKWHSFTS